MAELDITPELVKELHEFGQQTKRAAQTAIALTPYGWEVGVWVDRSHYPVAFTAESVYDWLDGEEWGDDVGEALATKDSREVPYRVVAEDGTRTLNSKADVVVVTGTLEGSLIAEEGDYPRVEEMHSWEGAWWFDLSKAREVVMEPRGLYRERGAAQSLWLTEGGRWVTHLRSIRGGSHETWCELDTAQAAEWAYLADGTQLAGMSQPVVVEAARAARAVADAVTAPKVRYSEGYPGEMVARVNEDAAAEAALVAAALGALVRGPVARALGVARVSAAQALVTVGSREQAAERLGVDAAGLGRLLGETGRA